MTKKKKKQLDRVLVERGLTSTLHQARSLIMAAKVIIDDHMIDKAGTLISPQSHIRIKDHPSLYVSRGGEKLEKSFEVFNISVIDRIAIDVGASTGGFTDCLLQKGASRVFAIDVGYGQLAWKLQKDKRVINLERTNIRTLNPQDVQPTPDLSVIDASFISLKKILPHVISLLKPNGEILSLIKPQFEAKKGAVEKGGIIRDTMQLHTVMKDMVLTAQTLSLHVIGIMESPLQGQKGNREFFMYMKKY